MRSFINFVISPLFLIFFCLIDIPHASSEAACLTTLFISNISLSHLRSHPWDHHCSRVFQLSVPSTRAHNNAPPSCSKTTAAVRAAMGASSLCRTLTKNHSRYFSSHRFLETFNFVPMMILTIRQYLERRFSQARIEQSAQVAFSW
jgi:hypothetical protein